MSQIASLLVVVSIFFSSVSAGLGEVCVRAELAPQRADLFCREAVVPYSFVSRITAPKMAARIVRRASEIARQIPPYTSPHITLEWREIQLQSPVVIPLFSPPAVRWSRPFLRLTLPWMHFQLKRVGRGNGTRDLEGQYSPVTSVEVFFSGHKIMLPSYLVNNVKHRWWREEKEGDSVHRVYGPTGDPKFTGNFTHIEFISIHHPEVSLTLEMDHQTHRQTKTFRVRFRDSEFELEDELPCSHVKTLAIFSFDESPLARKFQEAAAGIPAGAGPERADAIYAWLKELDSQEQAVHREEQSRFTFSDGQFNMPHDVVTGKSLITVLSESARNAHFVAFFSPLDAERKVVFEVRLDGTVINSETGQEVQAEGTGAERFFRYLKFPMMRNLLRDAPRILLAGQKPVGRSSFTLKQSEETDHALGLSNNVAYEIIKVDGTTSPTPTGAASWINGDAWREESAPDEFTAFPILVCDPAIEKDEAIPENIEALLERADSPYWAVPQAVAEEIPFLGRKLEGDYAYYKQLAGVQLVKGVPSRIYRHLTIEDRNVYWSVRMVAGNYYVLDGVVWNIGRDAGEPVLFEGRLNLALLAVKYGDGRILQVDPRVRDAFEPEQYDVKSRQRAPRAVRKNGRWVITAGEMRQYKTFDILELEANDEREAILRDEGESDEGPKGPSHPPAGSSPAESNRLMSSAA